jgi:hypothetical protein
LLKNSPPHLPPRQFCCPRKWPVLVRSEERLLPQVLNALVSFAEF